MGVAGSGKSSLGVAVVHQLGLLLIEGDDHRSAESLSKLHSSVALTEADRNGWLSALARQLASRSNGTGCRVFFSTSLVDSQFATLEMPTGETGVLRVDATAPLAELQMPVCTWLATPRSTLQSTPKEPT